MLAIGCGRLDFDARIDATDATDATGAPRVPVQQAYLKASSPHANDRFGCHIALSADGSTLVAGAEFENGAATGIDGDQSNQSKAGAGSAYVFVRAGGTWAQQAYVKASNTNADVLFGGAVALSGDGSTMAIGSTGEDSAATGIDGNQSDTSAIFAGAAYIFVRAGTTWTQQAYVKASNTRAQDRFGFRVALSADGSTLAVSAPLEDSAATGVGGNQADASAVDAGAVYVYTRAGTTWTQQAYLKASNTDPGDQFGRGLSLSADGSALAVAAPYESSRATGVGGDQADNSAMKAGALYVFARAGSTWSQQAYLKASNTDAGDQLGDYTISLSADGSTLTAAAGGEASATGDPADNSAPGAGAGYVFSRTGVTWAQAAYLKASNAQASDGLASIAIAPDGMTLVAGASGEASATGDPADNSAPGAGAAYLYARTGTAWQQIAYLKPANPDAGDSFAACLATDNTTRVFASIFEDSAAAGVGGDQTDNSVTNAGAIYVFE